MQVNLNECYVHKSIVGTLEQYQLFLNSVPQLKDILLNIESNDWFLVKEWLRIYDLIIKKFGQSSLFFIGQRTFSNAIWPKNITNFLEAFEAIDIAYHNTHKGGDIGHYKLHKTSQNSYFITCITPYPDYFNLGIIKGIVDNFRDIGSFFWVSYENINMEYQERYNEFYKIQIFVEIIDENEYIKRTKSDKSKDNWINNQAKLTDSLFQELMGTFQTVTDELKIKSITDELTGLYNRLYFEELIKEKLNYFHRYENNMTLLIADIDYFKSVNDTYGHIVGDEVLKILSNIIKDNTRISDIVTRWGGEEFAILLCNTSLKQAESIAELIKTKIQTHNFKDINEHITLSLGISAAQKNDTTVSWFKRADDALYIAKNNGRNCIYTL